MRPTSVSSWVFAFLILGTGIWGLVHGGFVSIWAPGIEPKSLKPAVALLCSILSIVTGAGLLWPRSAILASRVLMAFLLLWLIWCKGVFLIHAPADTASWETLGETAVVLAAAWALAEPFKSLSPSRVGAEGIGPPILFGLALIAFGISHFGYAALTASLVPSWLPSHFFWVYFTGTAYALAGIALILGILPKIAAYLAALQMTLFGILVWLLKIAGGAQDLDTLNETAISFVLAASAFVIASRLGRRTWFKRDASFSQAQLEE